MKGKLTRISSNHQNLRTNEIEGQTDELPKVGQQFVLAGQPLEEDKQIRVVYTTCVTEVEKIGDRYEFKTKNSHYAFEILEN